MRRLSFWGAVAGVGVLGNLVFQVVVNRSNSPGLAKLAAYKNGN